jgi:hypothetical protein
LLESSREEELRRTGAPPPGLPDEDPDHDRHHSHDLVLYCGDQSYLPGIVVVGRLEGDAVDRIAA